MLKTILPAHMREMETLYMQNTGVTGLSLMETAAAHLAKKAQQLCPSGDILCMVGSGNNGGDGLAAMRMLHTADPQRRLCCVLLTPSPGGDAAHQLQRLRQEAPGVAVITAQQYLSDPACISMQPALIIDALFGTGLSRPLEGDALHLVENINALRLQGCNVLAVDIPSGLCGATGAVLGGAVHADHTLTFHRPKPGLYLGSGKDHAGAVDVASIGIPPEQDHMPGMLILPPEELPALFPPRLHNTHKGNYGRLMVIAGSPGMAGAAALCATAALRTGAGLVTILCPERILDTVQILCPCATAVPLPEDSSGALSIIKQSLTSADAAAVGCGMGQGRFAADLLPRLLMHLRHLHIPTVLDADGLNLLARMPLSDAGYPGFVLTPHPAEAARLLKTDTPSVTSDPAAAALLLQQRYRCAVVLKGASDLICTPDGSAISPYGTPAMAKGGSGDVLTGIVGALLAARHAGSCSLDTLTLLQAACALHGSAGEKAEAHLGPRSVLATDLCRFI